MRYRVGLVALADRPYDDLAGLVAFAKEKGRATISVAGVNQELLLRQLSEQYGVNLVPIPGQGSAEAMTSALGGHVDATIQASLHVEQIKSGGMKQLASLIEVRVPYAPDSQTLAEQGATAMPLDLHTIFVAPKGLDPAVKTCLQEALDEAIASDAYAELMVKIENEAFNLGEAGMIEVIKERYALYKEALGKN
jgi:tripartite-type tricarboxylate transporter receptor subunit TctC